MAAGAEEPLPVGAVRIAQSDGDILATFDVMRQLRPNVSRPTYVDAIRVLQATSRYQLAILGRGGDVLAIAGFRIAASLAWGRYLYVEDLAADNRQRTPGAGSLLFSWLERFAAREDCDELRVDAASYRHDLTRFFTGRGMTIAGFSYSLELHSSETRRLYPARREA